jgi:uncharacterized membrane protein
MNIVADSYGERALFSLLIFLTLQNIVFGNLPWNSFNQFSFVRVVNDQFKVALLVVKGKFFGRWER